MELLEILPFFPKKRYALQSMFRFLKKILGSSQERTLRKYRPLVAAVNAWEERFSSLSDDALQQKTIEFRERLQQGESLDDLLPEAYGVVKSVCRRLCGTQVNVSGYHQSWDMVPYDVQILGAIAMHKGYIAEMQTGEGKTLTATMPLYLNALTGRPVHLVTVNDYLAQRDAAWVGTILRWLGLKTGVLSHQTPPHMRREVYESDVVYGTASEFGFDYLRDNSMCMRKEEQVQRGHYFAIIDEIDSILIDEARTPLIISGPSPVSRNLYAQLRDSIAALVRREKEYCNRIATEAYKTLSTYLESGDEEQSLFDRKEVGEKERTAIREACRLLWIVSRGMPNHKIVKRVREHPDLRGELEKWDLYFHGDVNKKERMEALADLYLIVEERQNEFELTDKGIAAWAETEAGSAEDFTMLDLGYEYARIDEQSALSPDERMERRLRLSEEDVYKKEKSHNIRQLLRAHLLMERDVDYIVEEGKIVIIDEHTGRPQPGRRFSDGLHQAIEAKEGVEVQRETQTYATITLQNYFRLYDKLAGMTGTAITEATEFKEIYRLEVLQIPTYKPTRRDDFDDEIYMTEREKYNALLKEVRDIHAKGRPILIGTESVEVSEKLSRILRQNKIEHTVLNAKNHAREAEIIAEAGAPGAVTVATNMAGRGTDIKLKGGTEALGGLHVIGSTRHQSRRIDRQLRGRSARLGDRGSSKFFLSFEDQLMRFFSSPRLVALLKRFRPPEGEAISAPILNRSTETAQKRIEARNYMMRKHTLEYDDVMNKQRQEIYRFRNEVLHSDDLFAQSRQILEQACLAGGEIFAVEGQWNPEGYREWLHAHFPLAFEEELFERGRVEAEVMTRVCAAFDAKVANDLVKLGALGIKQEPLVLLQDALRNLIVRKIDEVWQEHLLSMDHLRTEVNLRTAGQKDPLIEFKHEAFRLFHERSSHLQVDIAKTLFKLEIIAPPKGFFDSAMTQLHHPTI